jgi:hypothetical protein
MIIQLLGVALISLLNITPTIQQNNIEQLIAPNIEIEPMTFNIPNSRQIYQVEPYAYYNNSINQRITASNYDSNNLLINYDHLIILNGNNTFNTSFNTPAHILINNNNFYIYDITNEDINSAFNITTQALRLLITDYYKKTKGSTITSESFSFTLNTNNIATTSTYYTYTINGNGGLLEGRVYSKSSTSFGQVSLSKTNNQATVPQNYTLQQVVQELQPILNLELSSSADNKIWYYFTSSPLSNNLGQYTTTLFARTNYGRIVNFGSFTYNVIEADTTSPTITSIIGNSINWTNQNVTLTVQASDNNSLNTNAYSFDNGATYQASNLKTFTTNEIVNIKVRDSSNNETSQQVIINRIDKQSPSINLAGNWRNTFQLGELTSNNDLYNYLSISDGASGINSSLTTISNFNYNQAGTFTNIQVSVTDNAGNTNDYTLPTVTITELEDTSPPTISGSTVQTRVYGTVTTQGLLFNFTISDPSGIDEVRIQNLDNTIVTSWDDFNVGSHQLRVYARDTVGNIALYQFELVITAPPVPDTTPPVITGPLLVSFPMGTYTSTNEILALYTITDNEAVTIQQLQGTIDFETQGEYQVTIFASDAANNTTTRNIVVRIRSEMSLDGYNPITDLLSGIFGGVLSLIFTIGTINLLGFRLLDAMAIIILGGVIYLVYKAIRK